MQETILNLKNVFYIFCQWHLGFFKKAYTPEERGFQTFFGFYNGQEDYWDHMVHQEYSGLDLRRNGKVGVYLNLNYDQVETRELLIQP